MIEKIRFTHPDFPNEIRVETVGRQVSLIFVAGNDGKAIDLAEQIIADLENGEVHIVLRGTPGDKVTEVIDTILRQKP
jgi:hypothetical protein